MTIKLTIEEVMTKEVTIKKGTLMESIGKWTENGPESCRSAAGFRTVFLSILRLNSGSAGIAGR